MEKAAIMAQMTQMDMCYLNVDNRLCIALTGLWAVVTLLWALKAWSLDFYKSCFCPKEQQSQKLCLPFE